MIPGGTMAGDLEEDDTVAPEPHDLANAKTLGWLQHAVQSQGETVKEIKDLIQRQGADAERARREMAEKFDSVQDRLIDVEQQVAAFAPVANSISRWRDRSWGLLAMIGILASIGLSLLADLGGMIVEKILAAF